MTNRTLRGVGLFTGVDSVVKVGVGSGPLSIARGVVVQPVDVSMVAAAATLVNVPPGFPVRNTTLSLPDGSTVATIEHVLSAAAGLGLWNATIGIEGPEVPIDDGSAQALVALMQGLKGREVEPIVPHTQVEVNDSRPGGGSIIVKPRKERGLRFTYVLDYGAGSSLPPQEATWEGDPQEYAREVAPARTFSMVQEVQMAQKLGMFARFTSRDLLVVGANGEPIENAWRFANEPARHKLLDLIGDLALLGAPLQAEVIATRSGHAMTHELCRRILAVCRVPGRTQA